MTWVLLLFLVAREGTAAMPPVEFKREDLCEAAGRAFNAKAETEPYQTRARAVWVCAKQN